MKDATMAGLAELSRRRLLQNIGLAAGGTALLGTTASAIRGAAAQTKAAQKLVGYQDTPHGDQHCDNCAQFQPPSSCKTVDGTISPSGWCKIYVKKAASQ